MSGKRPYRTWLLLGYFRGVPTANKTITAGVTVELIRGDIFYWGELMAGAMLGSVPIVLVYVFFLDYYVSGLTAGAIK
jgi:multiple sugar transport system permease protein